MCTTAELKPPQVIEDQQMALSINKPEIQVFVNHKKEMILLWYLLQTLHMDHKKAFSFIKKKTEQSAQRIREDLQSNHGLLHEVLEDPAHTVVDTVNKKEILAPFIDEPLKVRQPRKPGQSYKDPDGLKNDYERGRQRKECKRLTGDLTVPGKYERSNVVVVSAQYVREHKSGYIERMKNDLNASRLRRDNNIAA